MTDDTDQHEAVDSRANVEFGDDVAVQLPDWVKELEGTWGEELVIPEWEDKNDYRCENGWKGSDLIHDKNAAVRITKYYVQYGDGGGVDGLEKGGIETVLSGIIHFTSRAESHAGYCHGGSMTSAIDDVVGWCAFLVTGECKKWSGYTVQINTSLKRPIRVNSVLLVRAKIVRIERRKVFVEAAIINPVDDTLHASGDGLVVLNRGVLPSLITRESTDSIASFTTLTHLP